MVLYRSSQQHHNENVSQVLSSIAKAGMKINRKEVFNVQELPCLKYCLSVESLTPLSSKVDAVLNYEASSEPSNL